jgi:hypothetical protein
VRRVFAQSLSDTFEDRHDALCVVGARPRLGDVDGRTTLEVLRAEFFAATDESRALIFQLLTKRPENVLRMVPASWLARWPAHVWIGATCENQEEAERRLPHLLRIPAPVRFVSVEPMLGPVRLNFGVPDPHPVAFEGELMPALAGLDWVICGGESAQGGHTARPFDLAWARNLRDQCRAAGVPFFLKQMGSRVVGYWNTSPIARRDATWPRGGPHLAGQWDLRHPAGADESEWPADLRGCRAFPVPPDALRVYSVPGREGSAADVEAGLRQADAIAALDAAEDAAERAREAARGSEEP